MNRLHIFPNIVVGLAFYAWGGWSFVVWGVFLRLVVALHSTWFVNSAAHTFGYRTYDTPEGSTNCWWVGLIAWGEGWHNNHHAFQRSARHGHEWWELDLTWLTIRPSSVSAWPVTSSSSPRAPSASASTGPTARRSPRSPSPAKRCPRSPSPRRPEL